MRTTITIADAIRRAGGAMVVAQKLNYAIHTVLAWRYGSRTPGKHGDTRQRLCKLAGVLPGDVEWSKPAIERALERNG
jgi:hypothetical protein